MLVQAPPTMSNMIGPVQLIGIVVLIGSILYLRTFYLTLKSIRRNNRAVNPIAVFTLLIPVIGYLLFPFVLYRISQSLRNEFYERNIQIKEHLPAFKKGMAFCLFYLLAIIPFVGMFFFLAAMVVQFLHWKEVNSYRLRLMVSQ